jgi:deoxyribonuclease V
LRSKQVFQFVNSAQAANLQRALSIGVKSKNDTEFRPRLVAGFDAAYDNNRAFTTAAVYDLEKSAIVETAELVQKVPQDYIPGFLGFREGPLVMEIARRLRTRPDVFLIDGHGRSHPRGFGIACHVGIALDKPTIGVAKSRLYGKIVDGKILGTNGRTIGRVLTSTTGKKYFVSIGHRISLPTAVKIVRQSMSNGFPMPLRRAHLDSIRLKERNR